MKNNKILYILTLIITLFSFNAKAYAEEAVCTYKGTIKVNKKEEIHYIYIHFDKTKVAVKELDPEKKAQDKDYAQHIAEANREFIVDASKYFHKFSVDGIDTNYMINTQKGNCPNSIFVNREAPEPIEVGNHYETTISSKVYNDSKKDSNAIEYKFDSATGNNPVNGESLKSDAEIENENESETLDKQDDAKCVYLSKENVKHSNEKHEIYMYYGKDQNGADFFYMNEYDPIKGKDLSGISNKAINNKTQYIVSFSWDSSNLNENYIFGEQKGECPQFVWVERQYSRIPNHDIADYDETIIVATKVYRDSNDNTNGQLYWLNGVDGNNPLTGEDLSPNGDINIKIDLDTIDIQSCKDLFGDDGEEIAGYFNIAWNIVKFGVPILLLALGTLDFAQAVFAGKEDGMKKAQEKFIKRVIIAVVIFLVPVLISFLLKIANGIWGNIGTDLCGLIF